MYHPILNEVRLQVEEPYNKENIFLYGYRFTYIYIIITKEPPPPIPPSFGTMDYPHSSDSSERSSDSTDDGHDEFIKEYKDPFYIPSRRINRTYASDDFIPEERKLEYDLKPHRQLTSLYHNMIQVMVDLKKGSPKPLELAMDTALFSEIRIQINKFFDVYTEGWCLIDRPVGLYDIVAMPFRDVDSSDPFVRNMRDTLEYMFVEDHGEEKLDMNLHPKSLERLRFIRNRHQRDVMSRDFDSLSKVIKIILRACETTHNLARSFAIGLNCHGATMANKEEKMPDLIGRVPIEWFVTLPEVALPPNPEMSAATLRTMDSLELYKTLPPLVGETCMRWADLGILCMRGLLDIQVRVIKQDGQTIWPVSLSDGLYPALIASVHFLVTVQKLLHHCSVSIDK